MDCGLCVYSMCCVVVCKKFQFTGVYSYSSKNDAPFTDEILIYYLQRPFSSLLFSPKIRLSDFDSIQNFSPLTMSCHEISSS